MMLRLAHRMFVNDPVRFYLHRRRYNRRHYRIDPAKCDRPEILDRQPADHAFVVGASLSLADIPVGALMYRYANLDITEDLPANVARWYASLTDREAYQAHIMLPFDELKGRLAP